jgi:hypothetical protein
VLTTLLYFAGLTGRGAVLILPRTKIQILGSQESGPSLKKAFVTFPFKRNKGES